MIVPGPLRWLDETLEEPALNVALDAELLRHVDEGACEPLLRVWELQNYAVILGRSNRIHRNVNITACHADGVPIIRRPSGGGTVLLGPGALVYSLVLRIRPESRLVDIDGTTGWILEKIGEALAPRLPGVRRAGISDLVLGSVKFSGNAQRWLRRAMLHHGTLLYDFDIARIGRYLQAPERAPDYRRGRDHDAFVRNIPLSRQTLIAALRESWPALAPMPRPELAGARRLVASRLGREAWTFKR